MGAYDRQPLDSGAVVAILTSIGVQVRDARQARGWHLSDLADRVGLSPSVVCRMELARREPSLNQLISACAALDMRFSGVLHRAEDDAFPLGHGPWR